MSPDADLVGVIRRAATLPPSGPELHALKEAILGRHEGAVCGLLFYGSCLRSGDVLDGLVDLYVVVESYSAAYRRQLPALLNWMLPPNVYYLELPVARGTVRCKYAVLSRADLKRGTSTRWFHSYVWGRFAQPTGLLYARDRDVEVEILGALEQAVLTFLSRALPMSPATFCARELWVGGLSLSYGAELRAEKAGRSAQIFDSNRDYYEALTPPALARLGDSGAAVTKTGADRYRTSHTAGARRRAAIAWTVRKWQGKLLSFARLGKALFTFQGGVDYILWKLERHSGVHIEATPELRRHPLVYCWPLLWRLYRQGVFR